MVVCMERMEWEKEVKDGYKYGSHNILINLHDWFNILLNISQPSESKTLKRPTCMLFGTHIASLLALFINLNSLNERNSRK